MAPTAMNSTVIQSTGIANAYMAGGEGVHREPVGRGEQVGLSDRAVLNRDGDDLALTGEGVGDLRGRSTGTMSLPNLSPAQTSGHQD
jgi:hypothetical protein